MGDKEIFSGGGLTTVCNILEENRKFLFNIDKFEAKGEITRDLGNSFNLGSEVEDEEGGFSFLLAVSIF